MSDDRLRDAVDRSAALALLRRPDLWPEGVRFGLRLAAPGWWRRWPPRPLPPAAYLRFRLQTQYGHGGDARLSGGDLVGVLEWSKRQPRTRR